MGLSAVIRGGEVLLAGLLLLSVGEAKAQDQTETALQITSNVAGARVFIDGSPEETRVNGPIPVEPGTHEIIVEAEGHATYKRWVTAEADRPTLVHVELLPVTTEVPSRALPPTPADSAPELILPEQAPVAGAHPAWYERWWVWTLAGVVLVGAGAVVVGAASGGDDFVPGGELPRSSTADWSQP